MNDSHFAQLGLDNATDPDVRATRFHIDHRCVQGMDMLIFTDNGAGMVPDTLHKMLSFGYCEKVLLCISF